MECKSWVFDYGNPVKVPTVFSYPIGFRFVGANCDIAIFVMTG